MSADTPTWFLLGDILDKREIGLPPALWFNKVAANLHKWARRIRMWIHRALNRRRLTTQTGMDLYRQSLVHHWTNPSARGSDGNVYREPLGRRFMHNT